MRTPVRNLVEMSKQYRRRTRSSPNNRIVEYNAYFEKEARDDVVVKGMNLM